MRRELGRPYYLQLLANWVKKWKRKKRRKKSTKNRRNSSKGVVIPL